MDIIYLAFFNLLAVILFGGMILFGIIKLCREQIPLLKACYIVVCAGICSFFISLLGLPVLPLLFQTAAVAFFVKRSSSAISWKKTILAALLYSLLQGIFNFILLITGLTLHKLLF